MPRLKPANFPLGEDHVSSDNWFMFILRTLQSFVSETGFRNSDLGSGNIRRFPYASWWWLATTTAMRRRGQGDAPASPRGPQTVFR
jgi:hypothetical protein